MMTIGRRKRRI